MVEASRKPLFATKDVNKATERHAGPGRLKSDILAEKSRDALHQTLRDNTRAAVDPFLNKSSRATKDLSSVMPALKRKRIEKAGPNEDSGRTNIESPEEPTPKKLSNPTPAPLVGYDSESD